MRELTIDDLRWVSGGLPASGAEGETVYENGNAYVWYSNQWHQMVEEAVIVGQKSYDPTPDTPYTYNDFLADQAAQDFLNSNPTVTSVSLYDKLASTADTIKKWRELTSPTSRDVIWRDNHSTFDGIGRQQYLSEVDVIKNGQVVTNGWYDTQSQQWWFDTNNNGTPDIVAKYNSNLDKMFADLDFNGTYETELPVK